ncbi:hypothetical protein DPMN_083814 [Dreissena polymorpha]|uniref:Uncharacterized protein n=1 Tax=Dreissena polymorpha TaxID=45954 RepID=A0A9D4BGI2_DREPO|nr:hypothetical protein DPMN_081647 [Dreissena polymorpha]KAH3696350.1 hypothetical protein DPMN_083814 [Dreissena polymorpha]
MDSRVSSSGHQWAFVRNVCSHLPCLTVSILTLMLKTLQDPYTSISVGDRPVSNFGD